MRAALIKNSQTAMTGPGAVLQEYSTGVMSVFAQGFHKDFSYGYQFSVSLVRALTHTHTHTLPHELEKKVCPV